MSERAACRRGRHSQRVARSPGAAQPSAGLRRAVTAFEHRGLRDQTPGGKRPDLARCLSGWVATRTLLKRGERLRRLPQRLKGPSPDQADTRETVRGRCLLGHPLRCQQLVTRRQRLLAAILDRAASTASAAAAQAASDTTGLAQRHAPPLPVIAPRVILINAAATRRPRRPAGSSVTPDQLGDWLDRAIMSTSRTLIG